MKTRRHAKILELIQENAIDTQEELLRLLRLEGFNVTQATVSRDIKELRLLKTLEKNGKYKYTMGNKNDADVSRNFYTLFSATVLQVDFAGNMIVLKTASGMAQGVCAALDHMDWEGVVGTIAGDDTIFIVARSNSKAVSLATTLKKLL
ncbi:MAG: arginine repressor [Acutalibacteraceae bacterium]|nr:arginine repressor [Acutalibacteraceae bacterium]HIR03631.1 arginine repressor [Candidatus Scatovicinus merdipullorum]